MPRKCVVGKCRSGYDSENKRRKALGLPNVPVFKFPTNENEKQMWISALPNILEKPPTKHVGVCELHFRSDYEKITVQGGKHRPKLPPSEFDTPASFSIQTTSSGDRDIERRCIDSTSRRERSRLDALEKDTINDWTSLKKYCANMSDLTFRETEDSIDLFKFEGFPPELLFSVNITKEMKVVAFKKRMQIPLRDIIQSFSAELKYFSEVRAIIEKLISFEVPVANILKKVSADIANLSQDSKMSNVQVKQLNFMSRQLSLQSFKAGGRRYSAQTVYDALNLFLRNKNCYKEIRKLLALPSDVSLRQYFGKLGTPGVEGECRNVVTAVFSKLEGAQKYCKILVDEIYIKPAVCYTLRQVIGYSVDDPQKPATTVLTILIAPLMGAPAFVARLFPLATLEASFLMDQILAVISIVHEASGLVFLVMNDNLRTNQCFFKMMHQRFGSSSEYCIKHPVENDVFENLFLLYDPTHLYKSIRNNWLSEKTKSLTFRDPVTQRSITGKWADLVDLYKKESESGISMTKLNYQTLYPDNFDKQKVPLVQNIFNEKTIAALEMHGCNETSIFLSRVTRMWNILNVKSPVIGKHLNDPDRYTISDTNDTRLQYLIDIADAFAEMNPRTLPNGIRVKMLTVDTSEALSMTLRGIVSITRVILGQNLLSFVMLGQFQSDRIEGEFGIYRQSAGGNYHISFDQVLNGLRLQRLKLFKKLNFEPSSIHNQNECCIAEFTENEFECFDECFEKVNTLTDIERATATYIAGYVTRKDFGKNVLPDSNATDYVNDCEFLQLVNRRELSLPLQSIYELALYCYCYFKLIDDKTCATKVIRGFHEIYDMLGFEIDNLESVLSRFANCFSKAYSNKETDMIKRKKNEKKTKCSGVKKTRISSAT